MPAAKPSVIAIAVSSSKPVKSLYVVSTACVQLNFPVAFFSAAISFLESIISLS